MPSNLVVKGDMFICWNKSWTFFSKTSLGLWYQSMLQCFQTNTSQELFKKTPADTRDLTHNLRLLGWQYNIRDLSLYNEKVCGLQYLLFEVTPWYFKWNRLTTHLYVHSKIYAVLSQAQFGKPWPRESHTWPLEPRTKSIKKHFTLICDWFLSSIFTYNCRPANQRMMRKKTKLCSCLE